MSFCARNSLETICPPASRLIALTALSLVASGCLVTTHEGPGHAPVVALDEPPPGSESSGSTAATATGEPGTAEPESISASHILVQYQGAERAATAIARTKEEARKRVEEALARARAGEPFAELVKEYSDEPGAAERAGKLGRFTRDVMVEEFGNAAFALDVGEISDVVESPFGFHVILREE